MDFMNYYVHQKNWINKFDRYLFIDGYLSYGGISVSQVAINVDFFQFFH